MLGAMGNHRAVSLGALGVSAALGSISSKSLAPSVRDGAAGQGVAERQAVIPSPVSKAVAEHPGLILGDPDLRAAWANGEKGDWGQGRLITAAARWPLRRRPLVVAIAHCFKRRDRDHAMPIITCDALMTAETT